MNFLFVSGSFRRNSRSLAVLKNVEPFFDGHKIETPNLDNLPLYNDDLNDDKPKSISEQLELAESADGILFCTPEYNHTIPAVLKNYIDWVSRPAFKSPLRDMPVSIISQADSPVGGARAQFNMKLALDSTLSKIHICHEMLIAGVGTIFSDDMRITNEKVLERLERHCNDFIKFCEANR